MDHYAAAAAAAAAADYKALVMAWHDGEPMRSLYHRLLRLFNKYEHILHAKLDIHHIYIRMVFNDSPGAIVQTLLFSPECSSLRTELLSW